MKQKKSLNRLNFGIIMLLVSTSILVGKSQEPEKNLIPDKLVKLFQGTLNQQREVLKIPGVSVAVILPDGSKWLGVSGKSSHSVEVNSKMLFGLGSVTMTYTATLILQLEQEGFLSLEDTIGKFIPELGKIDGDITIHQLLSHTSGLYRYQQKPEFMGIVFSQPDKIWTSRELVETFQGEPECQPGLCWGESGMDHILLGIIIEKITGTSISSQFETKIFTPLNLEHSFLYPEQSYSLDNMAHFWWDDYGSGEPVDVLAEDTSKLPLASLFSSVWAAGAMHSTAEDLATYIKHLFEGKVISDKALKKMVIPLTEVDDNVYYGFSVIIEKINGKTIYWHTGGIGYSSIYCYFPENELSIAVLCNQMVDPKPIALELYDTYLEYRK